MPPPVRHLAVAVAVSAALLMTGEPLAAAEPASDDRGFIDSTARCDTPDSAVVFGRTASSRVAICVDPDRQYEYRGVRVRDGAKLITSAEPTGDGGFVAKKDDFTYTVTASSLVVAMGERVIRDEPMLEFHEPNSPPAPLPAEAPPPASPPPPPPPAWNGDITPYFSVGFCIPVPFVPVCFGF